MKFEQVDFHTIKVILSDQDMSDHMLDYDQMDYNDQPTRSAILRILQKMQKKIPLDVEKNKLFIEAFPGEDGGCILFVNVVEFDKSCNLESKNRLSFDTPLIFSFQNLDIVLAICQRLWREQDHLVLKSSLFLHEKKYYLLLDTYCHMERKITRMLEEYGRYFGKGAVLAAFLIEHGKEISRDNAIETIVHYLS